MKRREAIKGLTALGALVLLPKVNLFGRNLTNGYTHFVGIGTSGFNTLEYLHSKEVKGKYTSINNSKNNPESTAIAFITFEKHDTLSSEIKAIFKDNSHYVIMSDLGGYAGTHLTKALFNHLHNSNRNFTMICSLPFKFEGKETKDNAAKIKKELEQFSNFSCYDPEKIRKEYGNIGLLDAFEKVNEEFYTLYKHSKYSTIT